MERVTIVLGRLARRGGDRKDGFLQLFISKRLIQGLATAMMGMFVPIFLYETTGEEFLDSWSFLCCSIYWVCIVSGSGNDYY